MTREELIAHFKLSTVPPEELWQDGSVDLATEVVYSLLPLNHDPITEYDKLIRGRTAIAFGFSNNEKRFLQRHIKKYGGKFRFTKNNKEDFFIVHPSTWIYDMLHALRKAREEGAIIIDFDDFSNTVGEHFSDEVEQKRKMQEREEEAARPKTGPIYKACSEAYLASLPKVPMTDVSLYDDVFHIIGNTEKALHDAFEDVLYSPGSHSFSDFQYIGDYYKRKDIYEIIEKKGGRYVKKEESPNITCVIYGKKPSDRAIKYFEGKAKLINVVDAVNWLKEQEPISPEARIFAERYRSSVDTRLRNYQQLLKNEVFVFWRKHFNIMLQLPTGTGKTVLFTSIIRDLTVVKDTKIVILAHRKELIDQISEHLSHYDIDHGIITSGIKRNLEKNVQVASVQTLTHDKNIELLEELKPNFIIIDEAHHSLADSYTKFWKHCGDCWKLGVTATPYRLNNKTFRTHFDKLVASMNIDDFINQDFLAEYDYMVDNPTSNLSQTIKAIKEKSSTGDYKTATLLRELNVPQHIQRLVVCYEQYVKGRKGIVYAINKEHAHNICEAYKAIGVAAVYIDSDTNKKERTDIVERFRAGDVHVMVNVDIFSEGFDCPDVEFIQMARPTWSLAKYLQQVGRGLRPSENKQRTVILDNSRMFIKFGFPSDSRYWEGHFNGYQSTKGLYKQEDEEREKQVKMVCAFSDEMMVKIDADIIRMAEELASERVAKEVALIQASIEAKRRERQEAERRLAEVKAAEERERRERLVRKQEEAERRFIEEREKQDELCRKCIEEQRNKDEIASKEREELAIKRKQEEDRKRQEEYERIKARMREGQKRKRRKAEEKWKLEEELKEEQEREETRKNWLKGLGYLVAASVALLVIWQSGLLIPLGLIGLASSGLFKR